jgi:hypothetical protein
VRGYWTGRRLGVAVAIAVVSTSVQPVLGGEPAPDAPSACVGDCDGDGAVSIDELVVGVQLGLDGSSPDACPTLRCNTDRIVTIHCLILAVEYALSGCPGESEPTPAPSRTPLGFNIDGCLDEFPGSGSCGQIGVGVRLEPLGLYSYAFNRFHFADVPPGDYVISVPLRCNPFGCWPDVPVTVVDHDVFVHMAITPKPTWTARIAPGTPAGSERPSQPTSAAP